MRIRSTFLVGCAMCPARMCGLTPVRGGRTGKTGVFEGPGTRDEEEASHMRKAKRRTRGTWAARALGAVTVVTVMGAATASPAAAEHAGAPMGGCQSGWELTHLGADAPSAPAFRDRNQDGYLCKSTKSGAYKDNNSR